MIKVLISDEDFSNHKGIELVPIECSYCKDKFYRKKQDIVRSRIKGKENAYCKRECQNKARGFEKPKKISCNQCGKVFLRKACEVKKFRKQFCSKSCSSTYNGKHFPKRKLEGKCKTCGKTITKTRAYCSAKCNPRLDTASKTLEEAANFNGQPSNRYRLIRDHALRTAKQAGLLRECELCGHPEPVTCHIKEIHEHSKYALISEINNTTNLIGLCRNCHWDLDHKKLNLELVKAKVALRNKQLSLL